MRHTTDRDRLLLVRPSSRAIMLLTAAGLWVSGLAMPTSAGSVAAPAIAESLLAATTGTPAAIAGAPPATPGAPGATAAASADAPSAQSFTPLDLPDWVILEPESEARVHPWILVVDDPQCPYCVQLHLALVKARELHDPEISSAVLARMPFPLAYHDQSAHIVADAFCLEASRAGRSWSAASYLDWLIVAPWQAEPEWKSLTVEELGKEDGFFDTRYDAHRVTSSRRRDFQTEQAKREAACDTGGCHGDADCEKLCATEKTCRAVCPELNEAPGPKPSAPAPAADGGQPPADREACLKVCSDRFVSARYRQYSKVHSACLLEEGKRSAHGKTAEAFSWAIEHKVPGTPTVYVGHPSIGFRTLGDSDHLVDFLALLRQGLVQTREKMAALKSPPRGN